MFDFDKLRKEVLEFEFSIVFLCVNTSGLSVVKDESLKNLLEYSKDEKCELIIVDNSYEENKEFTDYILSIPKLHKHTRLVFNNVNLGCSVGWNNGLKLARGKYIFGCASDYIVKTPNFLRILSEPMEKDEKLACTAHRVARVNSICEGIPFSDITGTYVTYAALDGLMLRKSALQEVGYIDEDIWPYMGEDQSLGLQLQEAGYKVMKVELPNDIHLGQRSVHTRKDPNDDNSSMWPRSSVQGMWDRNRVYMMKKHGAILGRGKTWND